MCGIIGYVGFAKEGQWQQTHDLLRALYLASEHRGQDSTGFVAQAEPLDNPLAQKTVVAKEPVTASRFVESNSVFRRLRHRRSTIVAGHVRAFTHGLPANNLNNHPHIGREGSGLYLVHNGICLNHAELRDKYALRLESECDSEVLLRLMETEENPVLGLSLLLREVEGSFAVAVYDQHRSALWLCRNAGRPLWLARLERDKRWFFASTGTILVEAFRKVLGKSEVRLDYLAPIPEDTPMVLSPAGMVLAPLAGAP
ncbi:MAG TPA: hypothetical protein VHP11_12325 [Tepidisphaeraceae bacterium]|nr:hypothetical protein [Tepidisphaeraceae bacterium]